MYTMYCYLLLNTNVILPKKASNINVVYDKIFLHQMKHIVGLVVVTGHNYKELAQIKDNTSFGDKERETEDTSIHTHTQYCNKLKIFKNQI